MHKGFLLLVFLFFCSVLLLNAISESDSESGEDYRITALYISGLNRTRLATAERPLQRFIGLPVSQVDPYDVRAALLATGILEPLEVEVTGSVLSVTLRERWSIFPIPVFMAGSDGLIGGFAFFDANAFGRNDNVFLAGMYGSAGWMASLGYIHAAQGRLIPGWNAIAAFSRQERIDSNQNNEEIRRFDQDGITFTAGLNFPLLQDLNLLSASLLLSYNDRILRDSQNGLNAPEEGLRLFGIGGELSARRSSWDGFFLSQQSTSLRYYYRTSFDNVSFHSIRLRGVWERSIVPGFRVITRTGIIYEPQAPVLFESSPSAAQVAILPRNFSARNYAGISAGLERYVFRIPAGTLSLSAAYQLVYSQGSILGSSFDHGLMGMLNFYLNRLAIPALGLGVAYNVRENYLQGSFSLGMSF